jgi:hypothetical protein
LVSTTHVEFIFWSFASRSIFRSIELGQNAMEDIARGCGLEVFSSH